MKDKTIRAAGFDEAFLGSFKRKGLPMTLVYDWGKCVEILMDQTDMDWDKASEFMKEQVETVWLGKGTPVFMRVVSLAECGQKNE